MKERSFSKIFLNRVCQVAGMFLCRFAGYNDGTRSVVFKIERIDIQENEEEKQ